MDSTQTTKATRLGVNLDKSKYVIMSWNKNLKCKEAGSKNEVMFRLGDHKFTYVLIGSTSGMSSAFWNNEDKDMYRTLTLPELTVLKLGVVPWGKNIWKVGMQKCVHP
jgi:hypothetical protein